MYYGSETVISLLGASAILLFRW